MTIDAVVLASVTIGAVILGSLSNNLVSLTIATVILASLTIAAVILASLIIATPPRRQPNNPRSRSSVCNNPNNHSSLGHAGTQSNLNDPNFPINYAGIRSNLNNLQELKLYSHEAALKCAQARKQGCVTWIARDIMFSSVYAAGLLGLLVLL